MHSRAWWGTPCYSKYSEEVIRCVEVTDVDELLCEMRSGDPISVYVVDAKLGGMQLGRIADVIKSKPPHAWFNFWVC